MVVGVRAGLPSSRDRVLSSVRPGPGGRGGHHRGVARAAGVRVTDPASRARAAPGRARVRRMAPAHHRGAHRRRRGAPLPVHRLLRRRVRGRAAHAGRARRRVAHPALPGFPVSHLRGRHAVLDAQAPNRARGPDAHARGARRCTGAGSGAHRHHRERLRVLRRRDAAGASGDRGGPVEPGRAPRALEPGRRAPRRRHRPPGPHPRGDRDRRRRPTRSPAVRPQPVCAAGARARPRHRRAAGGDGDRGRRRRGGARRGHRARWRRRGFVPAHAPAARASRRHPVPGARTR